MSNNLIKLEALLKAHDWYFNYSDDSRIYAAGRDEKVAINALMRLLSGTGYDAEAKALYMQYAPKL